VARAATRAVRPAVADPAFHHFNRWRRDGVLDRLARAMRSRVDAAGLVAVLRRRHQRPCRGLRRRGAPGVPSRRGGGEPADQALGRSRGGFGTKVHLLACGNAVPLDAVVTAGRAYERTVPAPLLDGIGRRRRPAAVACDKGYDLPRVRRVPRARRLRAVIPEKRKPHGRRPGRPPVFDRDLYRRRNAVERCVGWLKQCRRVATRYEKLAVNFLAYVRLAMIRRYLHLLFSDRT